MYLSARPECDSGLVEAGYSCHETSFGRVAARLYSGKYTREEARIKCSQDGKDVKGELAAPLSSIENEWFVDFVQSHGEYRFWLGVNDIEVNHQYNNQHGSAHTYFNWANNEPSGRNGENCVQTGGLWGYEWDDVGCNWKRHLLCTHVVGKQ